MARLVIGLVSCTKAKLPRAAPARELYGASWVFRKSVEYVERMCDAWHVLSARHGLVDPDEVVEPYDETLSGAPAAARRRWGELVRAQLEARHGPEATYVVLAGRSYADALEGLALEEPLRGLGTGERRRWLARNA